MSTSKSGITNETSGSLEYSEGKLVNGWLKLDGYPGESLPFLASLVRNVGDGGSSRRKRNTLVHLPQLQEKSESPGRVMCPHWEQMKRPLTCLIINLKCWASTQ
jgi:hypothetical protein